MGANIAIAASLIVDFSIDLFDIPIAGGIHGGTIALLLSLALFFGISLASKRPTLDPELGALMDI
jgi:hypothetical protein